MKIKKIEVKNFKAIDNQIASFNGCSAIITAGNNKGKTSFIKGLIDRFRSEKPDIILKQGTDKGFNYIELTDGSKIEWDFSISKNGKKSEKFAFISKEGIKQTSSVLKSIGQKYFGIEFDIDKFLNSTPKNQSKELQRLVGVDFTELDEKYKLAYEERTYYNRIFNEISSQKKEKPKDENFRKTDDIKLDIKKITDKNNELLQLWEEENDKERTKIEKFNENQREIANILKDISMDINILNSLKGKAISSFIDFENMQSWFDNIEKPKTLKTFEKSEKPKTLSTKILDTELENAQRYFFEFSTKLREYENWVKKEKQARLDKENAESKVSKIEAEKKVLIESAKLPNGFSFSDNGILYNNFPLNSNQISSSARYIAGLKLGAMVLGKIKTMHFDASFLDKNNLMEVEKWAENNDLQLLIERPDFDGGEIKYEII